MNKFEEFPEFVNIVKKYNNQMGSFIIAVKLKGISLDTANKFRSIYGSKGEEPYEAWVNFFNDVTGD